MRRRLATRAGLFLVTVLSVLTAATPAEAGGLIAPIIGLVTGLGSFATAVIGTALSIGFSLLANTLLKPKGPKSPGGVELDIQLDADIPQSLILGRAVTAGSLFYSDSFGSKNQFLVEGIALADHPCEGLVKVFVDGTEEAFTDTGQDIGNRLDSFVKGSREHLHFKFYDGSQIAADQYAIDNLGTHPERPWTAAMIGRGITYVRATSRFERELVPGPMRWKFVLDGIRLYDPRLDSTVSGGSGTHRFNDLSTHAFTTNLVVMVYNILRGIRVLDSAGNPMHFYGIEGTPAENLPLDIWFAAMNEADVVIDGEPQFHGGAEIKIDVEPLETISEIVKAMDARFTEIGGIYKIHVGAPGPALVEITDGDIRADDEDVFRPIKPLVDRVNHVTGKYTSPEDGWVPKIAPPREFAGGVAADGRRVSAELDAPFIQSGKHVQRMMQQMLNRARKERRHRVPLPPEFWGLEPGDVIAWTSTRNGYVEKVFEIEAIEDTHDLSTVVSMIETDETDFDWDPATDLIAEQAVSLVTSRPAPKEVDDFAVAATLHVGDDGAQRAAISVTWTDPDDDDVTAVDIEYRRTAAPNDVFDIVGVDPAAGGVIIAELRSTTAYEVRARFRSFEGWATNWSAWVGVTTLDGRIATVDVHDEAVTNAKVASRTLKKDRVARKELTIEELAQGSVDNLVQDPGAEQHTDIADVVHDVISGGGTWSILVNDSPRSGDHCFGFDITGQTGEARLDLNGPAAQRQHHVEAAEGDQFHVEAWTMRWGGSGAVTARLEIIFRQRDGTFINSTSTSLVVDQLVYNRMSVTATAPAATAYVLFRFSVETGGTASVGLRVDDFAARKIVTTDVLADNAVTAAKIEDAAVTASQLANDAVTELKIADAAVTEAKVAVAAITSTKLANLAVTTAKIAADAVTAGEIAAGAVGTTHLANLAVSEAKVADAAVTISKLASGAVDATKLASSISANEIVSSLPSSGNFDGRVVFLTTDKKLYRYDANAAAWTAAVPTTDLTGQIAETQISDAAISTPKLAAGSVTTAKVAAGAITANEIAANTITAGEIAAAAITATEIAADAIVTSKIAAGAVTAGEIAAGAVTTVKLDAGAVTAAKIAAGTITANEIAANTITAAEIAADTITAAEIAAGTITAAEIAALTITASEIATDAITAVKILAGAVATEKLAAEAVTAAKIAAATITGDKLVSNTLTTKQLVVTNFDNLVQNPGAEVGTLAPHNIINNASATGWSVVDNATNARSGRHRINYDTEGQVGAGRLALNGDATDPDAHPTVAEGDQFAFLAWVRAFQTPANRAELRLTWRDEAGVFISADAVTHTPTTTYEKVIVTGTAPAGAAFVQFEFLVLDDGNQGAGKQIGFDDASARRMLEGEIIVDGTITAANIAANTITAAEIASGTITATEIAANAIVASKIAAGAVTTAKLDAGAVTAEKIAAASITATEIATSTITTNEIVVTGSGRIQTANIFTDAITDTFDAFTEAAISADSGGAWTVAQTLAVSVAADEKLIIMVFGVAVATNQNNAFRGLAGRIRRDSTTTLNPGEFRVIQFGDELASNEPSRRNLLSATIVDLPSAGTRTYTLEIQHVSPTGGVSTLSNRSIIIAKVKK